MRELLDALRANREVLFLTTVASYSHMHYMLYGPPAHLLVLPGLAVAVFWCLPWFACVWADSRDMLARGLAALGALIAMGPAMQWAYVEAAEKALKADGTPLVVASAIGAALLFAAAVRGKVDAAAWGLGRGDLGWWGRPVAGLLLAVAIGIPIAVALFPEFAEFYPRYKPARVSALALVQYQIAMGVYMFCWEFLFRGFMLFGVARTLGPWPAILLQASPFFLLHEGKPEPELISSWFGGVLMGWLCWRARCMWPSFLLHWALYSSMEVASFVARRAAEG
jgi:membrane protease YdiL (CAAX protease family)